MSPHTLFRRGARRALLATLAPCALAATLLAAPAAMAKTLVYCSEGSPENFTPALNTTGTSFDAARPVYDKLTQFTRGSTQVEPGLAESWTVSPDAKVFTFKLRKGVKFHSGVNGFRPTRDFNADDVLFSLERQWKADHPYAKVSGGKYDYFADMGLNDDVAAVEKLDPLSLKIPPRLQGREGPGRRPGLCDHARPDRPLQQADTSRTPSASPR